MYVVVSLLSLWLRLSVFPPGGDREGCISIDANGAPYRCY